MTEAVTTLSKSDRKRRLKFLDELEAFGDGTTFHGLGYVFKQNAFAVRRLAWAAFFVASAVHFAPYLVGLNSLRLI